MCARTRKCSWLFLLAFRKTDGVAMEGEQLVNLVILGVHDINDQQYSASIDHLRASQIGNHLGGAYQGGTLFTGGDIIH